MASLKLDWINQKENYIILNNIINKKECKMNKKEKIQAKNEAMHTLISIEEIIGLLDNKANKNAISKLKELRHFIVMNFTDNKK